MSAHYIIDTATLLVGI